jgi:periplasmic copper chaperone A
MISRLILVAALLATPIAARAGSLQVIEVFTRAAPAGGVGGVFLTIVNAGAADRLTGAVSPEAEKAELHQSTSDNGIMKMRPVEGLDIPAGGTVKLVPGGYHLMLMGLKQALVVGGQLPVTLAFQNAGKIDVAASIVKPGGSAPAGHGMAPAGLGQMPGMAPAK